MYSQIQVIKAITVNILEGENCQMTLLAVNILSINNSCSFHSKLGTKKSEFLKKRWSEIYGEK